MNIICIHIINRYCGHSSPVTAAAFSCDGVCGWAGVCVCGCVWVWVWKCVSECGMCLYKLKQGTGTCVDRQEWHRHTQHALSLSFSFSLSLSLSLSVYIYSTLYFSATPCSHSLALSPSLYISIYNEKSRLKDAASNSN